MLNSIAMLCPICHAGNLPFSRYCTACSAPLPQVDNSQVDQKLSLSISSRIVIGLGFAFLMGWLHGTRSLLNEVLWPNALGYATGVLFIPAVVGLAVFGRKGNWRGFSKCFLYLVVILGLIPRQGNQNLPYSSNK